MTWILHQYTHNSALVETLAQCIVEGLLNTIDERGRASLAVSGGSTPVSLFRVLSTIDIPWSKVVVTLVDERWVPESHVDSNAHLLRRHLLRERAAKAHFVGLKTNVSDPFVALVDVRAKLLREVLPLDVAVLGMGEDGHTASLFPRAQGLSEALDSEGQVCYGIRPPFAPHARMTLSASTLLGTKQLFLHIIGEKKRRVLEAAIEPGPMTALPVRAVLHQTKVVTQIFYAEQD